MKQGSFNRLDIGAQYVFEDQFSIGITAANSPVKNNEHNSLISSISTFTGFRWQGFRFGYSYDFNTTQLLNTGGIHEFYVSYDFDINIR
jgi:hypothetical protein